MILVWRKKVGLDKQMLQTIKYCQNARLHKAHLVISGFSLILKGIGSISDT